MYEEFLGRVAEWSSSQPDIKGVALVGSYARGTAKPDSDIDVVFVCCDPTKYLREQDWIASFGLVARVTREDWGLVQSLRVIYKDGPEVEFCLTSEKWTDCTELDPGTCRVVRNGMRIISDPHQLLAGLLQAVSRS